MDVLSYSASEFQNIDAVDKSCDTVFCAPFQEIKDDTPTLYFGYLLARGCAVGFGCACTKFGI
jgi:hypothetical protein